VEKVWRARQERIRSIRIAWTEHSTVEKGAWMDPEIDPEVKRRGLGPMPPTDVSFEGNVLVALDGNLMRYELQDCEWSVKEGRLVPRREISTYDGNVATLYCPVDSNPYPQAGLTGRQSNEEFANVTIRPLLLFCRPLANECLKSTSLSGYSVATEAAVVAGRRCVLLEWGSAGRFSGGPGVSLWVDPERDGVVARYAVGGRDPSGALRLRYQADVSYRKDDTHGWVPTGWNSTETEMHKIYRKVEVTQLSINPTIDPSEFSQTEFAPGTWVFDRRSDQHWLVRKDGSKRPIAQDELGLPYERLLNSDPGESLAPEPTRSRGWFLTINLLVLFSAFGFLIYRLSLRRFRKRT
jgi:hypothetical protein